jgi:O-succinylbenzoate synthase
MKVKHLLSKSSSNCLLSGDNSLFLHGRTGLTFLAPVSTFSSETNEAASIIAAAMIVAWTLLNVESGMNV